MKLKKGDFVILTGNHVVKVDYPCSDGAHYWGFEEDDTELCFPAEMVVGVLDKHTKTIKRFASNQKLLDDFNSSMQNKCMPVKNSV